MDALAEKIRHYLQIYDPLGMGELTDTAELYGPVVAELVEKLSSLPNPEDAAATVHRVLFLTYGSQAGHPRNYSDLGRDLLGLVRAAS